jgi:hypothetical protein
MGNTTIAVGSDGSHALVVYARDSAGNIGVSGTVYFSTSTKAGEPFPYWIASTIVAVAAISAVILVYFRKFRKRGKTTTEP